MINCGVEARMKSMRETRESAVASVESGAGGNHGGAKELDVAREFVVVVTSESESLSGGGEVGSAFGEVEKVSDVLSLSGGRSNGTSEVKESGREGKTGGNTDGHAFGKSGGAKMVVRVLGGKDFVTDRG